MLQVQKTFYSQSKRVVNNWRRKSRRRSADFLIKSLSELWNAKRRLKTNLHPKTPPVVLSDIERAEFKFFNFSKITHRVSQNLQPMRAESMEWNTILSFHHSVRSHQDVYINLYMYPTNSYRQDFSNSHSLTPYMNFYAFWRYIFLSNQCVVL